MENQYIQEVLDGKYSSFSYFVKTYQDMAYSIAFRIVNNKEEAEEIVQDSFVKAYKALSKFRKDSKFSTWFYRIVVNSAISSKKQIAHQIEEVDVSTVSQINLENIESAYNNFSQLERSKFINLALEKIPSEDSMLLTLYYLNENSIDEIVQITGITGENVKMKLFRARKKLYLVLEKTLKSELQSIL
jgi:RNA polymerase sigma-70 factor (ECF subfamily)